jgi:hypothetical protein
MAPNGCGWRSNSWRCVIACVQESRTKQSVMEQALVKKVAMEIDLWMMVSDVEIY